MVEHGKLPGEYNIVVEDEYDLFDHRVPVEEFEEMLRENDVPDEVCVVGLDDLFGDDDAASELSTLMDRSANTLENRSPLPTIQFAVEGSFQRRQRDFELQTGGDLYRLSRVFGPQIERRSGGWLTAPF
ncbi:MULTISPECIES: hypothetical protein [Haloferacaceae]|jgi:hypothetical protein|uniref:DUF8076 domain-containing protein n=1 Tax=Halobellus ruber TaxID=2761102 RepID=A0A7J9SLX1_9EURY|nr:MULTISPECIES: hypothetical protein [Haloferacales]MBB6647915.1 hypothetical protein [Halobellus ruber]UIO99875.1 hypothetical protein Hbl1158_00440 [Halobaculum sp. CBA1158]